MDCQSRYMAVGVLRPQVRSGGAEVRPLALSPNFQKLRRKKIEKERDGGGGGQREAFHIRTKRAGPCWPRLPGRRDAATAVVGCRRCIFFLLFRACAPRKEKKRKSETLAKKTMTAGRSFTRRGWASYAAPVPTEGDEKKEWLIAFGAESKSLGFLVLRYGPSPRAEVRPAAARRDGGRGYNHECNASHVC